MDLEKAFSNDFASSQESDAERIEDKLGHLYFSFVKLQEEHKILKNELQKQICLLWEIRREWKESKAKRSEAKRSEAKRSEAKRSEAKRSEVKRSEAVLFCSNLFPEKKLSNALDIKMKYNFSPKNCLTR